jgi:hypothetical protein
MSNIKHILIQATDTNKMLQNINIDVRLDFRADVWQTDGIQSHIIDRLQHAISKLFNEDAITVTEMTETEYSQMINNGQ